MRKKAFTIIEILVVIAILAILAGLLVPLFKKPKGNFQSTPLGDVRWAGFTVEGCEYLVVKSRDGSFASTHKGNCTNEIHWRRLEK